MSSGSFCLYSNWNHRCTCTSLEVIWRILDILLDEVLGLSFFVFIWYSSLLKHIYLCKPDASLLYFVGSFIQYNWVCEDDHWSSLYIHSWGSESVRRQDGGHSWHWALPQNSKRYIQEVFWGYWARWCVLEETTHLLSLCHWYGVSISYLPHSQALIDFCVLSLFQIWWCLNRRNIFFDII